MTNSDYAKMLRAAADQVEGMPFDVVGASAVAVLDGGQNMAILQHADNSLALAGALSVAQGRLTVPFVVPVDADEPESAPAIITEPE